MEAPYAVSLFVEARQLAFIFQLWRCRRGPWRNARCGSVTDGADNICMDERRREDERNRLRQSTHDAKEGERDRKRETCFAFAVLSTNEPLPPTPIAMVKT